MQGLSRYEPRPGRIALAAVIGLLATVALTFSARASAAATPLPAPAPKACTGFRILHDDRIGAAVFPAGTYTLNLEASNLTCKSGAELFARFLEDYDGILPAPWKVSAEGTGRAAFLRAGAAGFSVELSAKAKEAGGTSTELGTLCRNPFSVLSTTTVGPLRFTKGKFLIYLPTGTAVTCEGAASLFRRFLGASPTLPSPWNLMSQTATFYKPSEPIRSAFRIEPLNGAGPR